MLVTVEELGKTSLYPELIKKITRDDQEAAELQILAAESLVKSYMSKYDLDAIFGTTESEPTFKGSDVNLIKKVVKIIASYYLVRLSNPNVNIELYRADYEDAIDWLKDLQAGSVNPSLPYRPDDPDTPEDESAGDVWWGSNVKRKQNFD
ncbi:MAG: phage protein Gp36 family protein [Dysgonomonas sp.]|uniref:phage protein Gp36 family protein n=1 Tax=Dysgonomonas sp. TaxID=1891233 RepID=UPI003A8AFD32